MASSDTADQKTKSLIDLIKATAAPEWDALPRAGDIGDALTRVAKNLANQTNATTVATALSNAFVAACQPPTGSDASAIAEAAFKAAQLTPPTNSEVGTFAQEQEYKDSCLPLIPADAKPASATGDTVDLANQKTIRRVQFALDDIRRANLGKPIKGDPSLTAARKCNAWLADKTAERQTQTSSASVQVFPKFNASIADNSQVVTTHFVSAYMPSWMENSATDFNEKRAPKADDLRPYVNTHFKNDIGFDVSSSVPVSSATLADYAKQELLTRDGGLLNLFASFAGRNYANEAYAWGNRWANLDRLYLIDVLSDHGDPASAKQAMVFISQGLGIKALKTALVGTNNLGAQGTAYIGIGFDGPLFKVASDEAAVQKSVSNSSDGMFSIELYACANAATRSALNSLAGTTGNRETWFGWGVNLTMFVTDTIGIQLQYGAADNSNLGRSLGHVAMLTVGYNKPASTGSGATQTADTPKASTSGSK